MTRITGSTAYRDAASFVGYPEDVAAALGLSLTNASCPGETTASFIDASAQSNGWENSVGSPVGYRTAYPLHVSYAGSQLDFAVQYLRTHPFTRLVTLMVGANDTFVCQRTTADRCTGTDVQATLAQVDRNVATILAALRHDGHYHGRLVVVSYYSLSYSDPTAVAGVKALNAALTDSASRYHAVVADGFGLLQQAAAGYGGDTCAAGLLVALPAGGCNIHPSAYGHLVLAQAVEQALVRDRQTPPGRRDSRAA